MLVKPFESVLFNKDSIRMQCSVGKPLIYVIYDETLMQVPFHLLRPTNTVHHNNKEKCLYEYFEMECVFSVKYLAKSTAYAHKFVKHNQSDSSLKLCAGLNEVEKIIAAFAGGGNKSSHYQFDLIMILINIDQHKGIYLLMFIFKLI